MEGFRSLIRAYEIAKQDDEDSLHSDATRFKIQELHALNSFCHEFSAIEYNCGGHTNGPKFNLPKSLKHDNLIEVNMSALAQENGGYDQIDREHFKEVFGNLNWNKFAERIQNQLTTNPNLTAEQKKLMQVNLIVALIRSNQFDQAQKELERVQAVNDHHVLKGIKAFFSLKDKKFDEALRQVDGKNDTYSVFLTA